MFCLSLIEQHSRVTAGVQAFRKPSSYQAEVSVLLLNCLWTQNQYEYIGLNYYCGSKQILTTWTHQYQNALIEQSPH